MISEALGNLGAILKRYSCIVTVLCLFAAPIHASVFVTLSTLATSANDGTGTTNQSDNVSSLPWFQVRPVTRGSASATTTYDFAVDGDDVTFTLSFDHDRDGAAGNSARSFGMFMFSPFVPVRYEISGQYVTTAGGRTKIDVALIDGVTNRFANVQVSESASTHSFALGQEGGDSENNLEGSLVGVLAAGGDYQFAYRFEVFEALNILAASADGQAVLAITPAVPGDFDADDDVDQDDFGAFQACMSGPAVFRPSECALADLDQDFDVDQSDFGVFQRCLTGPNVTGDVSCAE